VDEDVLNLLKRGGGEGRRLPMDDLFCTEALDLEDWLRRVGTLFPLNRKKRVRDGPRSSLLETQETYLLSGPYCMERELLFEGRRSVH